MFPKLVAALVILAVPAIAHAEDKPVPAKKHVAPPKHAAKAAPKKVAAVDPKGAAPKKVAADPKGDPKGTESKKGPSSPAPAPIAAKPAPPKPPCVKAPVEVSTGVDSAKFVLGTCDGKPAALAVEQLSILARPSGIAKPTQPLADLAKVPGTNVAHGIRRYDPGLVVRLQRVVDHFTKQGEAPKIVIVSGYRPASTGSYHAIAKALDFRIEGITNEALVSFCKTFDDTGCGYYPNSVFVHMDVRDGAGHVSWIDASGPGERPRYVTTWPPPPNAAPSLTLPTLPAPPGAHPVGPATHSPGGDPDDEPASPYDHREP